jgi:DNA-directed RNA polymerase subunit RPC12/RpoP
MKISTKAKCMECGRIFDLLNDIDAGEWTYGHDCEM